MNAQSRAASVMDPGLIALADLYADALLETVPDDSQAQEIAEEIDNLVSLLDSVDGSKALLTGSLLSKAQRRELVERIFFGRVSERIEALLVTLDRRERLAVLWPLARRFRKKLYQRQGCIEVEITTAIELAPQQLQQITQSLSDALGAPALLETRIDPGLLGGVRLRLGDRVYDASIAAMLKNFSVRLADRIATSDVPVQEAPAS